MQLSQPTIAEWALLVSGLSFLLSIGNFVWTIKRDRGLRPKVKVSVMVGEVVDERSRVTKIIFRGVNLGPGEVHLTSAPLEKLRKHRKGGGYLFGSVIPEPADGRGHGLPASLTVGKEAIVFVPFTKDCFLSVKHAKVGLGDSFGRKHWAPEEELRRAEEAWQKEYGSAAESGRERVKA